MRIAIGLIPLLLAGTAQAVPLDLVDGDRVVFIGDGFFERDIRHNYLETLLTIRHPNADVTFRNLGWSGDTVFVPARAGSAPNKGFDLLVDHVKDLKPTVLFMAYGMNESFEGEAGLDRFVEGYRKLLDALKPTNARLVLISPIMHEDLGRPLPDPTEHNRQLKLYCDAILKIANERRAIYVNLFTRIERFKERLRAPITDDGIHLNSLGYWLTARMIEQELGFPDAHWGVELEADGTLKRSLGIKIFEAKGTDRGMQFTGTNQFLTAPPPPSVANLIPTGRPDGLIFDNRFGRGDRDVTFALSAISPRRVMVVDGLEDSTYYSLECDGRSLANSQRGNRWARGSVLLRGADLEQVEELRKVIGEKNVLFFDRYRPQNDMYIFHGRKHEQGRNAVEIPQFDKFITQKEAEIARLRVPVKHTYRIESVN
jgi:lysophospholipase L1-like esterase